MSSPPHPPPEAGVEAFILRWSGREGGAERANYALFLTELCDLLGVARPEPASASTERNDYVFERAVTFRQPDGGSSTGRIDLYKRGCFVLEAKQSRQKGGRKEVPAAPEQADMFGAEQAERRGRRSAARAWDVLMLNARRQAEDYAKALPAEHGWPPFLLVCDVGHAIEVYADFSGQGKNYAQFPDRQGFRIFLEDLRDAEVRARLRAIWTDPHALDPTRRAARATREIAGRLAAVSRALERAGHQPEAVAHFLMRCLFTMFAEDVGLLPEDSFKQVLARCEADPDKFPLLVGQLWQAMDKGDFAYAIEKKVLRFNGNLFRDAKAFPLGREEIGELRQAAAKNWKEVEPAIFGTLLEQALDPAERRRLGAHYTPRAYVERLVVATVIEPLRADWAEVQATAERLKSEGRAEDAAAAVKAFHETLCATRVLDPACGTGNFLYVALELMKRLEGEVLEALADLGGQEALSGLEGHTVDPHQFLGLELNPRAAAIAELVLWLGFLQWHFRPKGGRPSEPILRAFRNINGGAPSYDAVLAHDGMDLARDAQGRPVTRTDAAGERVEVWTYRNPRRPDWPEAEFIVGNPPFIGGKDLRGRLGEGYAAALRAAHRHMNESADFVMYWWDRAAELLTRKGTKLRRFGLVTTNSITQEFSRRVIRRHLDAKAPVSLVMAIPDHPWTRATREAAAVRIAMTVAEAGVRDGLLREVTGEAALDTDQPAIEFAERRGRINADLTVGVDVTAALPLKANEGLCSPGVKLHGAGFIVTPSQAEALGLGRRPGLEAHIRPYRNGRDLTGRPRGVMVIDLFGLEADEVRKRFPEVYQHLLATVKPERDVNNREVYRENWWIFGEPRRELRPALKAIDRYIVTVETAKHRPFLFLPKNVIPDNRLICFALADAFYFGVLSSRIHAIWALESGGTLEDRPIYTKSRIFDPFPFPDPAEDLKADIRAAAEELDALRKARLAEHPGLTLTQMYNVLEKLRDRAALTPEEERIRDQGAVLILKELHERLDRLVFRAYGWPETLSDEEILARLVDLNRERAAEERRGQVRWLRPDYQMQRAGIAAPKAEQIEAELVLSLAKGAAAKAQKPAFPRDAREQTAAVMAALLAAPAGLDAADLAARYKRGRTVERDVAATLAALARLGLATADEGGFRLRRAA